MITDLCECAFGGINERCLRFYLILCIGDVTHENVSIVFCVTVVVFVAVCLPDRLSTSRDLLLLQPCQLTSGIVNMTSGSLVYIPFPASDIYNINHKLLLE